LKQEYLLTDHGVPQNVSLPNLDGSPNTAVDDSSLQNTVEGSLSVI